MLRNLTVIVWWACFACWTTILQAASSNNALHDLANLLHNRLVGVPAQGETLEKMIDLLADGDAQAAALVATEHPFFYDYKLRALFTPWSNREGSVSAPLNDMVNTMIGMVRDDVPFNQVLSGDIFYDVSGEKQINLQKNLQQSKQSERYKQPKKSPVLIVLNKGEILRGQPLETNISFDNAISGVLSTKAFGAAFYSAGTNRRATAFVLKNFLCHEIEQLHDIDTPKDWVRQDVDRAPSGDPNIFNERCVGCHAGMDALSGWSVKYDYTDDGGFIIWSDAHVQEKIFKNNLLTIINEGKEVAAESKDEGRNYELPKNQNDEFTNLWTEGKNASLGWRGETSGKGAKEFGEMMTRSKAFASCMARQVYQSICYLDPEENEAAQAKRDKLAAQLKQMITTCVSYLRRRRSHA